MSSPTPHRCLSVACSPAWWSRRRLSRGGDVRLGREGRRRDLRRVAEGADRGPRAADQLPARLRRQDTAGDHVRREPAGREAGRHRAGHAEGDHRRRGPRLLQAQRRRPQRRRPCLRQQPVRHQLPAGRLDADDAVRPAGHRLLGDPPGRRGRGDRGHQRPQAARDALRDPDRQGVLQGRDPGALPEHRVVRQRRVRRLRRQPGLLRQAAEQAEDRGSGDAGRHGQGADHQRPDHP